MLHFNFIFVLLAYLHVFNTWYYRVSSNNAWDFYFKTYLGQRTKSRGNREEKNTTGKNIATLNHFGVYLLSTYKKAEKKNCNKNYFLLQRKIRFNVEEEGWSAYL